MKRPIVLGLTHRLVCFDEYIDPNWIGPELLRACHHCGHEDSLWRMPVTANFHDVCWHCADNYYLNCPHCGYMWPEENMVIIGEDYAPCEDILCPDCAHKILGITVPSGRLALPPALMTWVYMTDQGPARDGILHITMPIEETAALTITDGGKIFYRQGFYRGGKDGQ